MGVPGVPGVTSRASGDNDLTLRDAQALVDTWMADRGWVYWHPLSQLARLTEEMGELARVVNHLYGEKPKKSTESVQDLGLEMADVVYTLICLANSQGIDMQSSLEEVLEKYQHRDADRYPTGDRKPPDVFPDDHETKG